MNHFLGSIHKLEQSTIEKEQSEYMKALLESKDVIDEIIEELG